MSDYNIEDWRKDQAELMQFISRHLHNEKLSAVMIRVLGLSRTAAYKRIRGETALTLYDLKRLKQEMNFSIDQFFLSKYAPTSFQYDALNTTPTSPHDFLINVAQHMKRLTSPKGVNYLYLCNEVPLYHLLQFPLLARFKMYVWNTLNWRIGKNLDRSFDKDTYTDIKNWDNTVDRILKMYFDYSGKEIWNTLFIDTTIEQVKYMFQSGKLTFQVANLIVVDLKEMINLLKSFSEQGLKFIKDEPTVSSAETKFYYTSVNSGSEMIYIESNNVNTVLTGYAIPNLMGNVDPRMTGFSERYINNILEHSINITKANPVQRHEFFSGLSLKIDILKTFIDRRHRDRMGQ